MGGGTRSSRRRRLDLVLLAIAVVCAAALAVFAGTQAESIACGRAGGRLMHAGLDSVCRGWDGRELTVDVLSESLPLRLAIGVGFVVVTAVIYGALERLSRPKRAA